jgi:glycosyltransferase involved in cell wall biosynthesis
MGWSIVRAIRSCQKQTHPAHEIVVVDDGSTDETRQIVTAEASKDSRIRYVAPPFNVGCAAAMSMGISKATGDWIAFLDADDELTPNSIADRISVLKERRVNSPD